MTRRIASQGSSVLTVPVKRFIGIVAPVTLSTVIAMFIARQSRGGEPSLGAMILIAAAMTVWFGGFWLCVLVRPDPRAIGGPDEKRLEVAPWRRIALSAWVAVPFLAVAVREGASVWPSTLPEIAYSLIPIGCVIYPFILLGENWEISEVGLSRAGVLRMRRSIEWVNVVKIEATTTLVVVWGNHGERIVLHPRLVDGVPVLAERLLGMSPAVESSPGAREALGVLAQK